MFAKLSQWVNERWPLKELGHSVLDEDIPGGASLAYTLGSATLIVLLLQVVTGVWQMFYYVPTTDHAYDSVNYLQTSVPYGWLIHGLHYWGASAMIILVVLHLARVFIWGAYKRPRELTWLAGVLLLLFTLGMSFTGAPLPWDERGYWAAEVGTSISGSIPLVGQWIKQILLGGGSMGQLTLSRFFILHVAILPGILVGIFLIHFVAFRRFGSVGPWVAEKRKRIGQFWPDQVFIDAFVGVVIFLILVGLSAFSAPPFAGPADPVDASYLPKPEWNFLFLYEALKFFPGRWEPVGTVGIPTLGVLLLVLVPFIDRSPERNPARRPVAMISGAIVGVALIALTVAGFQSNPEKQGAALAANNPAQSSSGQSQQAQPTQQVAQHLSSSAQQGQKLFESIGCTGCHSVNGSGGNVGPDLSNEAMKGHTRDWLATQIQNPSSHFPNSIMPPFSSLSSQQINQLVDYLQSLGQGSSPTSTAEGSNAVPTSSPSTPSTQGTPTPGGTPTAEVTAAQTQTQQPTAQGTAQASNQATPSPAAPAAGEADISGASEGNGPPGEAADIIGSAKHGATLFQTNCTSCHGDKGTGGVANPGSEDGTVPPLNPIDEEFADTTPQIFAENIDRVVQHGSVPPGSNPQRVMPAFGDNNTLTQQEIADIEAYVLQLNGVDRGKLVNPGMKPSNFFYIVLAGFVVCAWFGGSIYLWRRRSKSE